MAAKQKRRYPPRGFTRVRLTPKAGYALTVPSVLGRLVGVERLFRVELTDEGILYRYVDGGEPLTAALPDWLLGSVHKQ